MKIYFSNISNKNINFTYHIFQKFSLCYLEIRNKLIMILSDPKTTRNSKSCSDSTPVNASNKGNKKY